MQKDKNINKRNFFPSPLVLQDLSREELLAEYRKLNQQYEQLQLLQEKSSRKILEVLQHVNWEKPVRPQKTDMSFPPPFSDIFYALDSLQLEVYETLLKSEQIRQSRQPATDDTIRQLAEQENRLSLIIENTDDSILSVNRDFQVLVLNTACKKRFFQMYGRALGVNDRLQDYWTEAEQAYWFPMFVRGFQGNASKDLLTLQVQDKPLFLEVVVNPIRDDRYMVTGISVFCKDVTEQQLIEQANQESKRNLSEAHKIARLGSWEYNLTTEEITLSKEALAVLEMEQDDKMVMPISEVFELFIHPEDVGLFKQKIARAKQHIDDPSYRDKLEYRFIRPDGKMFNLILYSRFKTNEKGVIYGVTQDNTEQKAIVKQLREQNEELMKVNNELDRFVYRVSHDLRAPLTSILGLINVARVEARDKNIHEYLNLQEKSIMKLDRFIQEIIDLSKNARLHLSLEPIQFQTLVEEVLESQNYDPNVANIEKRVSVKQHTTFLSDRNRLYVVFNNLVSNAVRYANLQQAQPYLEIDIVADEKKAIITVKDNGIGIHAQHIDRVFDMFYRANDSRPGSGLGLYIVKETIQKLKGFIKLNSELGKGTIFKITLPNLQ